MTVRSSIYRRQTEMKKLLLILILLAGAVLGELIANDVLISLKNKKEFTNISKIPEELDYIKGLIRNQILSPELITNRSFLMQIIEEELNK